MPGTPPAAGGASSCVDEDAEMLSMQFTAALVEAQEEYAVALPEKLTPDGPWLVRRHVVVIVSEDDAVVSGCVYVLGMYLLCNCM